VDGNTDGASWIHTNGGDSWWEVDLGDECLIDRIVVWNRTDSNSGLLAGATVQVLDTKRHLTWDARISGCQKRYEFVINHAKGSAVVGGVAVNSKPASKTAPTPAASAASAKPATVNLLRNPSFEVGMEGWLFGLSHAVDGPVPL